ncbi:MAG: efflux RND transporter permease subunit, partial [Candidatus Delongbacteria bacterium]|nr:efflux RND transporter permease subunit [Candidatus Delongbacteria bacterium]
RLRPILMTTITTVFGMIPMAVTYGGSSELRKPLAITVIFGLSVATLLILVILPVTYEALKRK